MRYISTNKLEKLKINKNNVYIVIDFDKTITAKESIDSWAASASPNIVGEGLIEKMNFFYQKYKPIEESYIFSKCEKEKHMEEWYAGCMDLYYEYHLTQEKLKKSIKQSNLIFRKGAKEFLQHCSKENIPIIILSAGIGNVIEEFLKDNNCYTSNVHIISNFMKFNQEGNIQKFDNATMLHSMNKTMKNHLSAEIDKKLQQKTYKILMGDLIEDENMVEPKDWDTTLKIGILNNRIEENLALYQKHFDIVLTQEEASFELLEEIVFK